MSRIDVEISDDLEFEVGDCCIIIKPNGTIRKVILPLSMPGIIGGSILVFVPCLGAFIAPDLLGGGKKLLLGSLIQFQFSYARNWPFGAAMAMFLLALVILILFFNAHINKRHRENEVKG